MASILPPDDDVGLIVPLATPCRKGAASMDLEPPVSNYCDVYNVFCSFLKTVLVFFLFSEVDD